MPHQFDLYENPIRALRAVYPFVVILQSPFADLAHSRIVAPVAKVANQSRIAGLLTPVFEHDGEKYVLHVPALTTVRIELLRTKSGNIADYRDAITAALDHLFHDNG